MTIVLVKGMENKRIIKISVCCIGIFSREKFFERVAGLTNDHADLRTEKEFLAATKKMGFCTILFDLLLQAYVKAKGVYAQA